MSKKKDILKKIRYDLVNGTSHSVDYLLSSDIEATLSKCGINIRKFISPLLRKIYKTKSKYKLVIDSDSKKTSYTGGKIYILNHRQADDIVLGVNAVCDNGYIVFGNKYLALETQNGLGLWAYGMILLDRENKISRKATYDKMKFIINNGGNIIIYPEGYWNLDDNGLSDDRHGADDHNSDSWLIQDINIGVLRLAKELNCPIVPTVLHYDEVKSKICYAKKGDLFFVLEKDDIFSLKDVLLDIMRTMYYELMEKYSYYDRKYLESNGISLKQQWMTLKQELIRDCDIESIGYKLDLNDEKLIGKAKVLKPVVSNKEAFEHLEHLEYNSENAFLLSKRYSGKY